jgi:2,4-dienoyl-CoA reductase-like NADH-dependent reductase (Old Yellow Enzyme family)
VGDTYAALAAPGRIGPLEVRNRIVMAPMGANLAESDGHAGERMKRYFEARARGGVGLVVVDVGAVAWPAGVSNPFQLGLSSDEFLDDLADLAARVHAHGAKIAIQLHHGSKVSVLDMISGRPMWVPSVPGHRALDLYDDLSPADLEASTGAILRSGNKPRYHVMTLDDVAIARGWYADAAARVERAGFDGVEIHAGHGYLLQSFLSPASNDRDDEYGGPLEQRARFLVEVIADVRAATSGTFATWVRLDGAEIGIEGGITDDDAVRTAQLCADAGAHAVHVSAYADPGKGAAFTIAPLPHEPGAYLPFARRISSAVDVPVIAVGRIEPEVGDDAIAEGTCDFVAMGRKLLADPDLPNKLFAGARDDVRPCIYAYRCVGNIFLMKRSRCVVNPATGREHEIAIRPAPVARRVLVVGGGPAGMETARVAAQRGHDVVLCEASDHLGGNAAIAGAFDDGVAGLVAWHGRQLTQLGVDVRTGAPVDRALVESIAPDAVVVATGRQAPSVRPGDAMTLAEVARRLRAGERLAEPVVVLGFDAVALKVAERLVLDGYRVQAIVGDGALGAPLAPPRLWRALGVVRGPGGVTTLSNLGDVEHGAATRIETHLGNSVAPLADDLAGGPWSVQLAGDCRAPEYLDGAFDDAWAVAQAI